MNKEIQSLCGCPMCEFHVEAARIQQGIKNSGEELTKPDATDNSIALGDK